MAASSKSTLSSNFESNTILPHNQTNCKSLQESTTSQQAAPRVTMQAFQHAQDIISHYQSQPEMLKLILTSKIEEDRRRAEEARLHIKEIDAYTFSAHQHRYKRRLSDSSSCSSSSSSNNNNSIDSNSHIRVSPRRNPLHALHATPPFLHDQHNNDDSHSDWHQQERRNSAASAILAMGKSSPQAYKTDSHGRSGKSPLQLARSAPLYYATYFPASHQIQPLFGKKLQETRADAAAEHLAAKTAQRKRAPQGTSSTTDSSNSSHQNNSNWINYGSITQDYGCKNVYYKCFNSSKGCEANKTETFEPSGKCLVKYHGRHLEICSPVE